MKNKFTFLGLIAILIFFYTNCSQFHSGDFYSDSSNFSSHSTETNSSVADSSTEPPNGSQVTPPEPIIQTPTSGEAWPNEPKNFNIKIDCGFETPTCGGKLYDPYNSAGKSLTTQIDPTAPLSAPYVMRSTESYVTGAGGTQLHYIDKNLVKEIYVGFWWRTNPEFTGNGPNANKTFFIRGTQGGQNGVFYLRTNPGEPKVLYWSTQLANNLDQCHGAPDQDHCWPNVNTTPIVPGKWYRIEVYMKASSCPTCHDGAVKWWITPKGGVPVLQGNFVNFAYGPLVNEWLWSETWDGAGNGSGFSSDPAHFIDHLRISMP